MHTHLRFFVRFEKSRIEKRAESYVFYEDSFCKLLKIYVLIYVTNAFEPRKVLNISMS